MDVVPASPDGWTGDPFILRRDDGRLHGRGAVDMRGLSLSFWPACPISWRRLTACRCRCMWR
jgi:acetylornithine deacetylase